LSDALFAYGSLTLPPLVRALTGRSFSGISAELEGFAAYRVRGRPYPGIVEQPGARTRGILHLGLDRRTWAILDRFEGEMYEPRPVRVRTAQGASPMAITYLLRPPFHAELTREAWDPERFAAEHLPRWVEECRAMRIRTLAEWRTSERRPRGR
jgi:gamma-glutamylcyclotransferase (GGCT)/AIG2-like uncharacterized protein YtfP